MQATTTLCDRIDLSWHEVADADLYRVYRDDSQQPVAELPAGITRYQDTTATSGNHGYRVSSRKECGESTLSSEAVGERLSPPPAPTWVRATTSHCDRIRVTWNDVTGERGYRLHRDGDEGCIADVPAGVTSVDDAETSVGPHAYRVAAYDDRCGESVLSPPAIGERRAVPDVPTGLSASDGFCDRIEVSWDDVDGEDGYGIYRDQASEPVGRVGTDVTRYVDREACAGSHDYRITSVADTRGESAQSGAAMVLIFYSLESAPHALRGDAIELGSLARAGSAERSLHYVWGQSAAAGSELAPAGSATTTPAVVAVPRPILRRAYPNPLLQQSRISYELGERSKMRLPIYDVAGRHVRTLADIESVAGVHEVTWDGRGQAGRSVASGVYFIRMQVGGDVATRRLTVMH